MTRTFCGWVGGVLRLHTFYKERLGDMTPEDVVREGGAAGQSPLEFMQTHKQYFPTRPCKNHNRRVEIDLDAEVYVLVFELVEKYKEV